MVNRFVVRGSADSGGEIVEHRVPAVPERLVIARRRPFVSERENAASAIGHDLDRHAVEMRPISTEDLLRALIGMCALDDRPGWQSSALRLMEIFVDGLRVSSSKRAPIGAKKAHAIKTRVSYDAYRRLDPARELRLPPRSAKLCGLSEISLATAPFAPANPTELPLSTISTAPASIAVSHKPPRSGTR